MKSTQWPSGICDPHKYPANSLLDIVYIGRTFFKVKPYITPPISAKTAGD